MRARLCAAFCCVIAACGDDPVDEEPAGDQRPPERTMHWPASDAVVDTASPMIIVAFDEPIDPGSVGVGTLEVFGSTSVSVPVSRTVSATTIAIAPVQPLAPGDYHAKLAAGVADLAGNATTDRFEWSFTVPDRADHQAPHVVFVDPPDGATGVALDATVRVFFDEVIDEGSVSGGLSLRDASGTPITTTSAWLTTGISAEPTADLAPGEVHTATASAAISDLNGNVLGANHAWSFETAMVTSWDPAVALESNDGDAGGVDIAAGGDHDVVVAWFQEAGARNDAWAARRSDAGWGASGRVETTDPGTTSSPDVAMDDAGTATMVWVYYDTVAELRTSRQLAGGAWGAEEVLSQQVQLSPRGFPRLAVNRTTGAAAVVWQPNNFELGWRVRRFTVGTGWGPIETVNPFYATVFIGDPKIAMAANGDIVLIWHEYQEGADRLTASVRTTNGWGPAIRLGAPLAITNEPRLSMNASGQAMVVWNQSGSPWNVWVQSWSPTAGWGTAVTIDQTADDCDFADVAVSEDGSAIATWTEWPDDKPHAHAARWTQATGWQAPVLVDDHPGGTWYPALAIGDDGAAVMAWSRQAMGDPESVWAARYTPGTGWGVAEPIAIGNVVERGLVAAIGRDGVATLAWAAIVDAEPQSVFASRLP